VCADLLRVELRDHSELVLTYEVGTDEWVADPPPGSGELEIHASGVMDWALVPSYPEPRLRKEDHPALLSWVHDEVEVYFSQPVEDPMGLAAELLATHRNVSGRFIDPGSTFNTQVPLAELLARGHGQVARGPIPLIAQLRACLEAAGANPSLGDPRPPKIYEEDEQGGRWLAVEKRHELRVLELGLSWIVARSFRAEGRATEWMNISDWAALE